MVRNYLEQEYYIAVFHSRNHAVQLYQYLKRKNILLFQLISTPCKLKTGCSYSLKINRLRDLDLLKEEINQLNNRFSYRIYHVTKVNGKKSYDLMEDI